MKKLKYLLLLIILIPISSKAAVYHCSAPSSVVSGQNFEVRFYGSLSSSNATWSGTIFGEGNARYVSGGTSIWSDGASFSRTVTYNAGNPGTARFYVGNVDVSDENQEYSGSDTCTVTIVAANSSNSKTQANVSNSRNNNKNNNSNKSNNNSLKKLYIDGVELSPEFNKDTLEYTSTVEGDKEKIAIEAEPEDGKATVEGDGEKDLAEGPNELIITVRAENGDAKEYKLVITRKEKNPIEVIIDKKKYTVVKKETDIEIPEGFEKETIKIGEEDVVAYSNKTYTLVVLVDEEGSKNFFIYDQKNDTYTKYVIFKTKDLKLMIIEANKKDIPYGYKEIEFTIDGQKVKGYYYKSKDRFRLVYAANEEDGKEDFYQYDLDQKTFQRFNDTQVKEYLVYLKYIMYGVAGAVLIFVILFGSIISLVSKNRKLKKGVKEESQTREERRKQIEEQEEKVDKKALKAAKKEKKRKAKEEKKLAKVEETEKTEEPTKEDKIDNDILDKKALKAAKKEQKRLELEEDKKRRKEADDFLK